MKQLAVGRGVNAFQFSNLDAPDAIPGTMLQLRDVADYDRRSASDILVRIDLRMFTLVSRRLEALPEVWLRRHIVSGSCVIAARPFWRLIRHHSQAWILRDSMHGDCV